MNEVSKTKNNKIIKSEIVKESKISDVPKSNFKVKLTTSLSVNNSIKLSNQSENNNNTNDINYNSNNDRGNGKKSSKKNNENWCDGNSLFDAVFMVDSNLYSNQVGTDQKVKNNTNNTMDECSKQILDPNVDTNILNLLCNMSNIGDKASKTISDHLSTTNGVFKTFKTIENNILSSKSKLDFKNIDNDKVEENINNDKKIDVDDKIITKTDDKTMRLFEYIEKKEINDNGDIPILKENSPSPCTVTLMSTPPEKIKSKNKRLLSEQSTKDDIILKVNNKKLKTANLQSIVVPAKNHISNLIPSRSTTNIYPPSSKPHIKRIRPTFLGPIQNEIVKI